jgi:hypothetical protein
VNRRNLLQALAGGILGMAAPRRAAQAQSIITGDAPWPPAREPLVEGPTPVGGPWSISLPERFARREENGSLLVWRPGMQVWIATAPAPAGATRDDRIKAFLAEAPRGHEPPVRRDTPAFAAISYLVVDRSDDGLMHTLNAACFADDAGLTLTIFFDEPHEKARAAEIASAVIYARAG